MNHDNTVMKTGTAGLKYLTFQLVLNVLAFQNIRRRFLLVLL